MISTKLSDNAILSIKGFYYRFIVSVISKNEAINLMKNLDFNKKNIKKHKNLLTVVKLGKEILTFRNIEIEKNKFYHHKIQ